MIKNNEKEIGNLKEEIKKLREENKKLKKLREKELNGVREEVKREIELENIVKRIINFIKSNGVEVILYVRLPITITVKKIYKDSTDEEDFEFVSKLNDFINLNLDGVMSRFLTDDNEKKDWVYSVIHVLSSLEDNLTLLKYLIRLSEKEELVSIYSKQIWPEELYNSILEK